MTDLMASSKQIVPDKILATTSLRTFGQISLGFLQSVALSTFGKLHFTRANSSFKNLFSDIMYFGRFAGS
jgi:hypothetical protein